MFSNRDNLVMIHNGIRYTGRFIASTTPGRLADMDFEVSSHRALPFIRARS